MAKSKTEKTREDLLAKQEPEAPIATKDLLSTGSTLLNLQCSGKIKGAFPKGKVIHLPGDSDSGKTILAMTIAAEACLDKNFSDYHIIYDPTEDGMDIDLEKMFPVLSGRLEPPADGANSTNLEDFYLYLNRAFDDRSPFIYIVDSMDALITNEEESKYADQDEAHATGKAISGSYGASKPKLNSARLRVAKARCKETGSILIMLSQTRDKFSPPGAWIPPGPPQKTYSGGHALKFYSALQIWLSTKSDIKKRVLGKDRQLGITANVEVKKNHITGRKGKILLPIYWSSGIHDVASCVDFLVEEGHWPKNKSNTIHADIFGKGISRDDLVANIIKEDMQKDLKVEVGKVWREIENACTVEGDNRYGQET